MLNKNSSTNGYELLFHISLPFPIRLRLLAIVFISQANFIHVHVTAF